MQRWLEPPARQALPVFTTSTGVASSHACARGHPCCTATCGDDSPGAPSFPAQPRVACADPDASPTSKLPRAATTSPGSVSSASPPAQPCAASSPTPSPPVAGWAWDLRFVYTRRAPRVPPPDPLLAPAPPLPKGAAPRAPVVNQHGMTTRAKSGFWMPPCPLLQASPLSLVPKTFCCGLADPNWRAAMEEEFAALLQNNTWDLVPRSSVAVPHKLIRLKCANHHRNGNQG